MKCECCNHKKATVAQQRDYIHYVCGDCYALSDGKFYGRINRREERRGRKKVEAQVDILRP